MVRGVERWSTTVDDQVTWWARVFIAPESYVVVDKTEYEAKRYEPPFWQVRKLQRQFSKEVAAGMARLTADLATRFAPHGFLRTKARLYVREHREVIDSIFLHRGGSSYGGAPANPSISIRVMLGVHVLSAPQPGATVSVMSDNIRKPDGTPYHDRFNSETWSTYDLCVEDLTRFVTEFAEPWFAKWRDPKSMLGFPDLPKRTRVVLEQVLEAPVNPQHVAYALKACGIKKSKLDRGGPST